MGSNPLVTDAISSCRERPSSNACQHELNKCVASHRIQRSHIIVVAVSCCGVVRTIHCVFSLRIHPISMVCAPVKAKVIGNSVHFPTTTKRFSRLVRVLNRIGLSHLFANSILDTILFSQWWFSSRQFWRVKCYTYRRMRTNTYLQHTHSTRTYTMRRKNCCCWCRCRQSNFRVGGAQTHTRCCEYRNSSNYNDECIFILTTHTHNM